MPRVRPTGVTAIEAMDGAVTVNVVDWERPDKLAEMLVVPAARELTRPAELTVAIDGDEELHETRLVRSALLPSV